MFIKNHYERAVLDFLRSRSVPYLRVHEAKRSVFSGTKFKSFDLVVYPEYQGNILVDVKGRKWPYLSRGGKRYWENWVTAEDLESLRHWEMVFGQGFRAAFVFCYWLTEPENLPVQTGIHAFGGHKYGFLLVWLSDYTDNMRLRSRRWRTVSMGAARFRELAQPLEDVLWPG
ncbi:MAG: HYExAFE family protein [Actinobacteria bacterium]|nr:HYExAFE family protein [Actinomycetota bacterium]